MEEVAEQAISLLIPIMPGLVLGFFLGVVARKALSTALMIAAVLILGVLLAAYLGAEISAITDWLRTASSWAGGQLSDTRQYLAAVLPTLAGLGVGFKLGLGRS